MLLEAATVLCFVQPCQRAHPRSLSLGFIPNTAVWWVQSNEVSFFNDLSSLFNNIYISAIVNWGWTCLHIQCSTLKKETCFSETSVSAHKNKRRQNPEDHNLPIIKLEIRPLFTAAHHRSLPLWIHLNPAHTLIGLNYVSHEDVWESGGRTPHINFGTR
jgi:hypothetical protein